MEGNDVFDLSLFNNSVVQKKIVNEIVDMNEMTEKYGLRLSEKQVLNLLDTRNYTLKANSRIEFGVLGIKIELI